MQRHRKATSSDNSPGRDILGRVQCAAGWHPPCMAGLHLHLPLSTPRICMFRWICCQPQASSAGSKSSQSSAPATNAAGKPASHRAEASVSAQGWWLQNTTAWWKLTPLRSSNRAACRASELPLPADEREAAVRFAVSVLGSAACKLLLPSGDELCYQSGAQPGTCR